MSAFLGPIHFWLYGKINLQQELIEKIVNFALEKGVSHLQEKLDSVYGEWDKRPMEEIIDENNIHGWLQSKVSQVEYKLAKAVTILVNEEHIDIAEIEKIFASQGKKTGESLSEDLSVPQVYKVISDSLLDGMPCDHAMQLMKQEEDEVIWRRNICVHEHYWAEVGGDIGNYYLLRNAFIEGLAQATNLTFTALDETTYELRRGKRDE